MCWSEEEYLGDQIRMMSNDIDDDRVCNVVEVAFAPLDAAAEVVVVVDVVAVLVVLGCCYYYY